LFTVVDAIEPSAGDVVFAFGKDETLRALVAALPPDVLFRGHGTGFGVAVIDASEAKESDLARAAASVCRDVIPFDQRGCLSPRIAIVLGSPTRARVFSEMLALELTRAESVVPCGQISADEAAESARYRDTMRYAASLFAAGPGWVGLAPVGAAPVLPPVGRHLHVMVTSDVAEALAPISRWVTAIGVQGPRVFAERVAAVAPLARQSALGSMQKPPFDGPVDLRRISGFSEAR
ncbi:MAG TPA: acyl-CoA reductase, partial [Polyangiaceae bacterium]|nr:acyl-CoA reductase [Polyangiaceae bacterium]